MTDLPQWLLQSIQSLGVAGGPVMFFFWFLANRERKEWQKDFIVRTEKFITTANEMATAMKSVTTAVAGSQATLQEQQTLLAEMAATLRTVSRRKD